jgi:sterol desaturase/sphingolipid hydroxylase (fatty acid hydroxylase superfamily)
MEYLDAFMNAVSGSMRWYWRQITFDVSWYQNFFWGLIIISLFAWALEIAFPWRKNQSIVRKDFWLDGFYMFFNFFIFATAVSGIYKILELLFKVVNISAKSLVIFDMSEWALWAQLLVFFVILDFVQWFTHVLLHKYPFLWKFHKVHHSVKEMGFAAHLRYHWMENLFYKPLKTVGVMLIGGFQPEQAFIVHFFAITIGHLNHSNVKITWGPLKYIFNNPVMHLYHHASVLPDGKSGVNYGISLSLWDYIFKTDYIPEDSGNVEIGFEGDEKFPKSFLGQITYGFKKGQQ